MNNACHEIAKWLSETTAHSGPWDYGLYWTDKYSHLQIDIFFDSGHQRFKLFPRELFYEQDYAFRHEKYIEDVKKLIFDVKFENEVLV